MARNELTAIVARNPKMATTTRISTRVNPPRRCLWPLLRTPFLPLDHVHDPLDRRGRRQKRQPLRHGRNALEGVASPVPAIERRASLAKRAAQIQLLYA